MAGFCRRRVVRVRSGGTDSSSEESENAGLDGGAAACAAAMGDEMLGEVLREAGVCCGEDGVGSSHNGSEEPLGDSAAECLEQDSTAAWRCRVQWWSAGEHW
jgi:hypothetical protein